MQAYIREMLQIQLNGEVKTLIKSTTIAEMVAELGLDSRKIAIEQNRIIVPKSTYSTTTLSPADEIEIVAFMGGG
jgi:thiamine biosynthesis protein ThiS